MALRTVTSVLKNRHRVFGARHAEETLVAAVQELQRLKVTRVAGAGAAANIAVAGIAVEDTILAVLHFDISTGTVVDVLDKTSEASITSAGNIQLSTTATTGDVLVVLWYNKTA